MDRTSKASIYILIEVWPQAIVVDVVADQKVIRMGSFPTWQDGMATVTGATVGHTLPIFVTTAPAEAIPCDCRYNECVHQWGAAQKAHQCPGCSGTGIPTDVPQVLRCQGCGGVFTREPIVAQRAERFVAFGKPMLAKAGPAGSFYFDFDLDTRPTIQRIHGWADQATKRVVQWG